MDEKPFLAHLKELYDQKGGLEKARSFGWERFCELGLPKVNLKDLYSHKFSAPSKSELAQNIPPATLVFINGNYSEELSNKEGLVKELVIMPLSKAFQTFGTFLQGRLPKEEKEAFAALNFALAQEGVFIYLPPKTVIDRPLNILNIADSQSLSLYSPRLHLYAGKLSQIKVYMKNKGSGPYWCNGLYDFALDEGANCHFYDLSLLDETCWQTTSIRATLKKQSRFKSLCATNGSKSKQCDFHAILNGQEAEVLLQGVWLLENKKQAHFKALVEHKAMHTRSMQKFKGACKDFSRSSFEGKIKVQKEALKTEAYQVNHNLILSEKAQMESKPNLEIFADDVKASHGATVGRLDKESLFYLASRGISEERAKKMLVNGFLKEVLDDIEDPVFKAEALELIK